jgi:hypothetical protein
MQFIQTLLTIALCAAGALMIIIGTRQENARNINRIAIVSPRAKHAIGILLVLIGVIIFLSQFIVRS